MFPNHLRARVVNLRYEARRVVSVELRPAHPDVHFPEAEAGAHIDLHLGDGLVRSYSLTNPGERQAYVIAVLRDSHSRGGSAYVHEQLRVGQVIDISVPRNHFKLNEHAAHSVLLAGGIGITPVYAMLQRLMHLKRSVELIYFARSREDAAYVDKLNALEIARKDGDPLKSIRMYFNDELEFRPDLLHVLSGFAKESHFYCCGPVSMLDAFEAACEMLRYPHVHMERFTASGKSVKIDETDAYRVELKKSCKSILVLPGSSLLDALLENGLKPDFSCREGVCGACETRVLAGKVIHRDHILTKQEQAENKSMMICVSSGCDNGLILDL